MLPRSRWPSYDTTADRYRAYDGSEDLNDVAEILRMTERKGNELLQEYVRLTHEWHARVLGYGFSYCYTRAFAGLAPFADANAHEDWQFVIDCVSAGGAVTALGDRLPAATIILYTDTDVLHVSHGTNTSSNETTGELAADEFRAFHSDLAELNAARLAAGPASL